MTSWKRSFMFNYLSLTRTTLQRLVTCMARKGFAGTTSVIGLNKARMHTLNLMLWVRTIWISSLAASLSLIVRLRLPEPGTAACLGHASLGGSSCSDFEIPADAYLKFSDQYSSHPPRIAFPNLKCDPLPHFFIIYSSLKLSHKDFCIFLTKYTRKRNELPKYWGNL